MTLIEGLSYDKAMEKIFFIDSKGLLYDRPKIMKDLLHPKRPFVHSWDEIKNRFKAVKRGTKITLE